MVTETNQPVIHSKSKYIKNLEIELSFTLIRPLFLFKIDCPIIELLGPPRTKVSYFLNHYELQNCPFFWFEIILLFFTGLIIIKYDLLFFLYWMSQCGLFQSNFFFVALLALIYNVPKVFLRDVPVI